MDSLSEWIFNAPWWLLLVAGVAGIAALLWALGRRDKVVVRGAVAVILVVAVWTVLTLVVETPTQKAVTRVKTLVEAFDADDWALFGSQIEDETRFARSLKGQEITQAARETKEQRGIGVVNIRSLEVQRDEAGIRVIVRVHSSHSHMLVNELTTMWRFDFNRRQDEWRLESIEPLATERLDVPAILRQVVEPPRTGQE